MKTQQEFQLHYWGPHFEMVKEYNAKHGCDVKPWECVKTPCVMYENHPGFILKDDNEYTFALTILYDDKRKEHRPVLVGDKIYCVTGNGQPWTVSSIAAIAKPGAWDKWSWNPPTPKRTFKIEFTEDEIKFLADCQTSTCSHVLISRRVRDRARSLLSAINKE